MDLTSFNEGEFFDVNLVPYGCEENPAEDLQYVAILFVEFELGERMFIEFVDRTNIVLPSELNVFANTIENLHHQILQELSKNLRDFHDYYNHGRVHASLKGVTPIRSPGRSLIALDDYRWRSHCRGLYQLPVAA